MGKLNHSAFFWIFLQLLLLFSGVSPAFFRAFASEPPTFRGSVALADTQHAVEMGQRPSGSAANQKLREWILAQLKPLGGKLTTDSFIGYTPDGPVKMANIVLEFPGTSGRAIAVTGHFDTKKIPMVDFLGANDGGSSTGFLIEFARVMAKSPHHDDLYVVFFDGEEAVGEWTDRDSVYGSKHLAQLWAGEGVLAHLDALINVDMIGDKDLDLMNDGNSNGTLRADMLSVADKLGDGKYFHKDMQGIDDDHIPFAQSGVNVLDVIDFNYGPNNAYWHTAQDTMDKLSAHSLQVVGDVVVGLVKKLDR
jgi:glutaminyl-peptide cyclotransferase